MSLIATAEKAEQPRTSLRRRVWSWVGIVAVVVVIGGLLATLRFDYSEPEPLSIDSPRYDGTRALATLLEAQGVEVTPTNSAEDAGRLAGGDAVLVVTDATRIDPGALRDLAASPARTVILRADFAALDEFFPGIGFGGSGNGASAPASCEVPEAQNAGEIVPGEAYSLEQGTGCYPTGDGYGLVTNGNVYALDGGAVVTNEHLATAGHAALALGLLGDTGRVVWYAPTGAELTGGADALGDLVPAWVTPVIVLLGVVAAAAAVWRGRRFGPLVAENLPVTVRAAETLEGRARLYRDGLSAAHAYDAIAGGATRRMAARLALAPDTDPETLSAAIAARIRRDPHEIRVVLTHRPTDDSHFADLGARLREIEDLLDATDPWEGRSR